MNTLNRDLKYLENSAENINNMFTTGYKSKNMTFHETVNGMRAQDQRDFDSGVAKHTGRELDFAIDGRGFFEVQLPDGTLGYTRNGSLKLNANGELVTSQGYAITNKSDPEIDNINRTYDEITQGKTSFSLSAVSKKIQIPTGKSVISGDDGTLFDDNGNSLGKLRLVTFQNLDGLKDAGMGVFLPTAEAGAPEEIEPGDKTGETQLRQGYLEASNLNIIRDMAKITQTNTAIKAHLKVIKMLDQLQESLNSTLSRSI